MSSCSPSRPEQDRLLRLLLAYDRDEVWLRTVHLFPLSTQPAQVMFDVVDAAGTVLCDTSGRRRTHTLQLKSPTVNVVAGQWVHLVRRGPGIQVQILPLTTDD